jgi:hypothetical protein
MAGGRPESTTFQRSEIWTQLASKGRCAGASSGCPTPDFRPPQARRDRLGRRQLSSTTTAWTGTPSKRPGSATPRPRPNRQGPGPRARQARARTQDPWRLHHHPAAGQEPAALGRAHAAAQGPGVCADAAAGADAEQAAHPGDLPQQRGMGRRRVWRRGRRAALLQEKRRTPVTARGRPPGRHAARPPRRWRCPSRCRNPASCRRPCYHRRYCRRQ